MTAPHRDRIDQDDPIRPDDRAERAMTVLERDLASVGLARDWFTATFGSRAEAAQADDARLVISELVTNALRHGLGEVVLRCSIGADGALDVSVTDSGEERPTMLPPDPKRIGGIGLRVVDSLSTKWGISPFPGGKTVWASIARPGA